MPAIKPNLHHIKSELTRERLLSSAMIVLQESGSSQLSLQAVAQAAGMTTGAVQHHYASKAALVMQVLTRLIAELEGSAEFWPSPHWRLQRRADHFVQQAWLQLYSTPRFATAWSAYLAARDDVVMTAHIIEQRANIQQRLRAQFVAAFPELENRPQVDASIQFVFSSLRGMGLVRPFASESAIQDQLSVLSGFIQSLSN
ncbi:MAG: HTH-type transcriptional regulator BetI [Pseudomonadota bacterium]